MNENIDGESIIKIHKSQTIESSTKSEIRIERRNITLIDQLSKLSLGFDGVRVLLLLIGFLSSQSQELFYKQKTVGFEQYKTQLM